MKKVIILGSEGFIGSHLVKHFLASGYQVAGCDLYEGISRGYAYFKVSRLSPEWEDVFSRETYDCCINAAGSGNVPYSMSHPFIDFEANTLDTIRVLEAIRRYIPTCRYLHLSSAAVYGNPGVLPVSEDASKHPLSPYGWHKWMAEQICREYHTVYHIAAAAVRPFSVYGPGLRKQLFWDIFQKLKADPATIEMWGTGEETRDFIHIDDLVKGINLIAERAGMRGEVYNLSSGIETNIRTAVGYLLSALGSSALVRFNNKVREGDPLNWKADVSRVAEMGFKAETTLEVGLKQLAGWLSTA